MPKARDAMIRPVSDDERSRSDRALQRQNWPGKLRRLDALDDAVCPSTDPGELIASVTAITLSAWAMMNRAIPDYSRATAPGCVIRPGDK